MADHVSTVNEADDSDLSAVSPELYDAVMGFESGARNGGALPIKTLELIGLAVVASACTLDRAGIESQVSRAMSAGASTAEIADVLASIAPLGVHAFAGALPIVFEEYEAAGQPIATPELGERVAAIKAEFVARRGYWTDQRESLARHLPSYFESYMKLSGAPWDVGVLDDLTRELILVAIDCSVAHMYGPGARVHMRNAIALGATLEQLLAVLEIASTLGVAAYRLGLRCAVDLEAASAREERRSSDD